MRNAALALTALLLVACSNGSGDKPMPNTVAPPAAAPARASPAEQIKAPLDETAAAKGEVVPAIKAAPGDTGLLIGDVPVPNGVHVKGLDGSSAAGTTTFNVHTNDPAGKLHCPDDKKDHCAEQPDGSITVHTGH